MRHIVAPNNTEGAKIFASNAEHSAQDIDANWWEVFSGYRLKQWQKELDLLTEKTGLSLEDVCEYTGLAGNDQEIVFYHRLPRKRDTFIGIGMAFGRDVHTINRWIGKYGRKRQLYAKDITEDLIWIYLIEAAAEDRASGRNYFRMYDACADAAHQTYYEIWSEHLGSSIDTSRLMDELKDLPFDGEFQGLKVFIAEHLDAFKTAYAKPRRMLADYVDLILSNVRKGDVPEAGEGRAPLSVLRGYLDDSQINYLAGDPDHIHVTDRRGGHRSRRKHIPKGRRSHVSIALALGMMVEEIDEYLDLMGFTPLDAIDREEGILINALKKWEGAHPQQRALKQLVLQEEGSIELTDAHKQEAVGQMLRLRQDLHAEYDREGLTFRY